MTSSSERRKRLLKLRVLLYLGAYGQVLHSTDYPQSCSTMAGIKRYLDTVPEVCRSNYFIGTFVQEVARPRRKKGSQR